MTWFRRLYLPNEADAENWDVSPIKTPPELLAKLPPAWIAIAELDLLAPEARAYAELLKSVGVAAEVKVYEGSTHPILTMDGMCSARILLP